MKNSRKVFVLTEAILAAALVLVAAAMLLEQRGRRLDRVSVIVQDSDASRWTSFRYGLKMAAEDQQIELSIVSTEDDLTVGEEQSLIEREIENGADAVIAEPVAGAGEMLEKAAKKVPVMLVGGAVSDETDGMQLPVTQPDHEAVGAALAEELLKDCGGDLEQKTLGIIMENDNAQAQGCEKGLRSALKDRGGEILWSAAGGFEKDGAFWQQPRVDFVIALDDGSLLAAGREAAANNLHGARVYGVGNSTEAVYYLDSGNAECLIVPDGFNLGYQSLTETAKSIGRFLWKMDSITVDYAVIRRETLFSKENQELLFTMNQ